MRVDVWMSSCMFYVYVYACECMCVCSWMQHLGCKMSFQTSTSAVSI